MSPVTATDSNFVGLKLYEWLTLLGIVLGPIIAVLITLWIEGRRRKRDQQIHLMRMLLTTRHLPGDAAYTIAINTIPVEFNKSAKVMAAWHIYIEAVRYRASPENADAQIRDTLAKQTKLIFEVMRELGFRLSETDIQNSTYAADGFIQRDNIMMNGWRAWPRIAEALEYQVRAAASSSSTNDEEKYRRSARGVARIVGVLAAIQFDHQPRGRAAEIGSEARDRHLASTLGAFDLSRTQVPPQPHLGIRRSLPQPPCPFDPPFRCHRRPPSPNPLPQGRGLQGIA